MKKSLIALAVAAAVIAPSANAATTLYGKVRQSLSQVEGDAFGIGDASATRIHDQSSRIGVKGSEDLGNGLSAIYQFEFGVGVNGNEHHLKSDGTTIDNSLGNSQGFSHRNQFVGLKGGFGTFIIGRHDTPAKMVLGNVPYFFGGQHEADDKIGIGFASGKRVDNVLAYISPNMGGFTFAVATVAGEDDDAGVSGDADGLAEGVSVGLKYANGPFYAGLGYTKRSAELLDLGVGADDEEITGLALMYNPGAFQIGYMYEDTADSYEFHLLVGGYKFGNNHVKLKYGQGEYESGAEVDTWGLWLEHNFSKRTKVFLAHSVKELDTAGSNDSSITSFGLEHSF